MREQREVRQTEPQRNYQHKKVLIVEDDLAFRPFWQAVFEDRGPTLRIDWATTQEEAETLLRAGYKHNQPYDLVISDIFLEGEGTGVDLWNRYGEEAKHFIFVSGKPLSPEELRSSLSFGQPAYLQKPLSLEQCRQVVSPALEAEEKEGGS